MKKILFVCDGKNFSNEAFHFVTSLYEKEPFLLTGAFFHSINYGLVIPNTFAADAGPYLAYTEEENEAFLEGIKDFKDLCEKNNIEYRIHEESDSWRVTDVAKESRFADLMVLSSSLYFSNVSDSEAKSVLRTTLHNSECPIIVIPEKAEPVNEIVFAYDGKKDSVYAIKQFTYLFPDYCKLETTIVYFNEDPDKEIPEFHNIQEYAARHFPLLNFEHLNYSKKSFSFWLKQHKNAMLVAGAYSRSGLSMAFNKSFAEDIINSHSIAVFISHLS
jgi:nucleotide-binding universal stress UspA family protein